jgi:hypothetical protein
MLHIASASSTSRRDVGLTLQLALCQSASKDIQSPIYLIPNPIIPEDLFVLVFSYCGAAIDRMRLASACRL